MRIMVTGGAGYVGSSLVGEALAAGHDVCVVDNLRSWSSSDAPIFDSSRLELRVGDIRSAEFVASATRDCDAIVHLAAIVGYPACAADPMEAFSTNVHGTEVVLDAAEGRPVVVVSSLSCIGRCVSESCDEETAPNPLTEYGSTKLRAEQLALQSSNATILRPATAFGVSPRMRFDLLANQLTRDAKMKGWISVYEPLAMRCFIHVRDLANATLFALAHIDTMRGGIYHVGHQDSNVTKLQFAETLRRITGCELRLDSGRLDQDRRDYTASFAKMGSVSFRPRRTLELGVLEMLAFMAGASAAKQH